MKRSILNHWGGSLALLFCAFALNSQGQHNCLLAHFPFNGNATDSFSNAYPATKVGTFVSTADRNAVNSGAMLFDGDTNYMNLNNGQPVITTNEFTISLWARMDGAPGGVDDQGTFFEQRDDVATTSVKSSIVFLADFNSQVSFQARTSTNVNGSSEAIFFARPAYGNWHHYVALLGADDTMRLYLDGVQMAKTHFPQTGDFVTSVDNVGIGVHRNFGQVKGLFNGAMDDVKLYDCGLTPQEIWTDYTTGFRSVNESKLQLYPNPFNQSTTLQFENPAAESFTLTLLDGKGQVVRKIEGLTENQVTLYKEELALGIYFVQLSVKNEVRYSGKLVVE